MDDAESDETRINAGALPVIGFGIVLSSGATDFARLPVWANILFVLLFLGLSAIALWPAVRPAQD